MSKDIYGSDELKKATQAKVTRILVDEQTNISDDSKEKLSLGDEVRLYYITGPSNVIGPTGVDSGAGEGQNGTQELLDNEESTVE